jgi:hypothetical protein
MRMRSRFADKFNHDADAPDYDVDVAHETHPVRAGYSAVLEWVARTANLEPGHYVLELGAGTGTFAAAKPSLRRRQASHAPQARPSESAW